MSSNAISKLVPIIGIYRAEYLEFPLLGPNYKKQTNDWTQAFFEGIEGAEPGA